MTSPPSLHVPAMDERHAQELPRRTTSWAKFLEGEGKPPEALAEYRKSLQIEINRPPFNRNIERLEKKTQESPSGGLRPQPND